MDGYPKYGIHYRLTEKPGGEFRNFMQKGLDGDFANRQQSFGLLNMLNTASLAPVIRLRSIDERGEPDEVAA
jgi:hypothetical protein